MRFCLNSIRKIIIRVTSSKRYQNVRSDQTILGPFANVTLTLCVSWVTSSALGIPEYPSDVPPGVKPYWKVMRTTIKARISLNFGQIRPMTEELSVISRLEISL